MSQELLKTLYRCSAQYGMPTAYRCSRMGASLRFNDDQGYARRDANGMVYDWGNDSIDCECLRVQFADGETGDFHGGEVWATVNGKTHMLIGEGDTSFLERLIKTATGCADLVEAAQ